MTTTNTGRVPNQPADETETTSTSKNDLNTTDPDSKVHQQQQQQQTHLNELLSMLLNEPENIGIKLLLNQSKSNKNSDDDNDDDDDDIPHDSTIITDKGSSSSSTGSSKNTNNTQQQQQQQQQEKLMITTLLRRTSVELFQHIETLHQSYTALLQQKGANTTNGSSTMVSDTNNGTHIDTLSGLPQLYVSTVSDDGILEASSGLSNNENTFLDAETIWGQVELQNAALVTIMKRSIRQLIVVSSSRNESNNTNGNNNDNDDDTIRLLREENDVDIDDDDDDDMNEYDDDDDEEEDKMEEKDLLSANGDDDDDSKDDDDDEIEDATDDENLDEETKRIRRRMERTMDEMSDDDDDDENDDDDDEDDDDDDENDDDKDDDDNAQYTSKKVKKIETITDSDRVKEIENDPAAAQLHDGFFNLQEMEEFADEEEEYLPNDAYGPISKQNTGSRRRNKNNNVNDTRTFHQKQRDGDMTNLNGSDTDDDNDDDDEDEDDDDELLFKSAKDDPILQRRTKYRDDEDIEALYHLYDPIPNEDGDDDDDDDDIIHMTAADLFGPPNRKFYNQWNQTSKKKNNNSDDDNNDDYEDNMNDFATTINKNRKGWNDDDENENENENDENDDIDNYNDMSDEREDEEPTDEEVPMKGNGQSNLKASERLGGNSNKQLSSSSRLLEQTEQLERDMLAEKPWQMKGETGSSSRPVNSLLNSTPEFEVATKVNPIITIAHTANIEEMIKQRVMAEDWDDIIPRELPDINWYKKKNTKGELPEVSQEKSKLGLGELYEREYLKKAIGYDVDAAERLSSEDQLKNEMKSLFANLCSKLDALSNYHFTPRPVAGDTEVRPITIPAIALEEVLPIHVSDARGVAPEEVYGSKKRGREAILRDTSELDQIERKRLRNSKKSVRRKERRAKDADEKLLSRLEPSLGLNNPYEKRKIREELSMARAGGRVTMGVTDTNDKYGTSHTFFQRLQNEAEQTVRGNNGKDKEASNTAGSTGKHKYAKSSAYKL